MLDPGLTPNDLALRRERTAGSQKEIWQFASRGLAVCKLESGSSAVGNCQFARSWYAPGKKSLCHTQFWGFPAMKAATLALATSMRRWRASRVAQAI